MPKGTDMNQIEKVARAICAADPEIRRGDAEHIVQQLVNTEWRNYTDAAKAAIAAMSVRAEPVAWMYEGPAMLEDGTIIQDRKCFPLRQIYKPSGWTETPLYALPTPPAGGSDAE